MGAPSSRRSQQHQSSTLQIELGALRVRASGPSMFLIIICALVLAAVGTGIVFGAAPLFDHSLRSGDKGRIAPHAE